MRTLLIILFLAAPLACDRTIAQEVQHPGATLYARYCVGCHGSQLQGGTAANLTDEALKYGSDRARIYKSIDVGIEEMGMPGYGGALTEQQLDDLTDFVVAFREGDTAPTVDAERVPPPPPIDESQRLQITTLDYKVNVDVFVDGLAVPWAIDWMDSNTALITEKRGTLRIVENGKLKKDPVAGTPEVLNQGQGGLMEVAFDPYDPQREWVYLGYSHTIGNRQAMTKIVRGKINDGTWTDEQVLFEAPRDTYRRSGVHYGTRIVFDGDGHLYFAIGDRGAQAQAQDLSRPNGKIHRLNLDGSIPTDNPFVKTPNAMPSIFSYGHRNPQGLSFHPVTNNLWDAEHGPRGGDELNISKAGLNYGWPLVTYGINYNGTVITKERVRLGTEQPVYYWRPSIAVCGIEFYTGTEFPFWQNHLLVGALAYQEVQLLHVENSRVIHQETILKGMGRVREVTNGPDGAIYVVANGPDRVLRLSSGGEAMR